LEIQKINSQIKREEAESESCYFKKLFDSGVKDEYFIEKMRLEAWKTLSSNQRAIIVPYEAAKFLGSTQIIREFDKTLYMQRD